MNANIQQTETLADAMGRGGGESQIDLSPARLLSFDV